MNVKIIIQACLCVATSAVALAPADANAAVTISIKQSEAGAPFTVNIDYQGWLATDLVKFDDKDSVTFGGKYQTGGPDGSGTEFAWMVDPKSQGVLDMVEIHYVTQGGVTTVTGRFESFGAKAGGALPNGVTGVVGQPALVNITDNFYTQSGGVYTPVALPGGLTINVEPIASSIPEPEEYAMLLLGFGMVGYQVKRKRSR